MGSSATLNVGLVGACARGGSFKLACDAVDGLRVLAVCDTNKEGLDAAAERLGAAEKYADFETMLDRSDVDAVILGTPMQCHAPQAIAALSRGIHVMSEVTAGVSVDESRALVHAANESKATYMMAENYTYMEPNVLVRELVRRGEFGTPFYAEGEYIHELKWLNETTTWRRKWQTGVRGVTYGTHSLGPILQWMPGDRVVRVCCESSGSHYKDPRGEPYAQDGAVMLCKTGNGALIKVRVDMVSDRPHSMTNYQLQGTDGCYESARGGLGDINKIWLRSRGKDPNQWLNLGELRDEFMPDFWKKSKGEADKAGHGGGDYFEVLDFVNAIRGEASNPIGIHEAMDMTLPGLVSQQSILEDSRWIDVPDSREWT